MIIEAEVSLTYDRVFKEVHMWKTHWASSEEIAAHNIPKGEGLVKVAHPITLCDMLEVDPELAKKAIRQPIKVKITLEELEEDEELVIENNENNN